MPTKAETKGLHAKLAEVMEEVQRIEKRGTAPPAMGGFRFVQIGDVADPVRTALAKRHLSMLPTNIEVIGQAEHETRSGGSMTTLDVRVTWTVTDGESGDSITFQSIGAGADAGDKYTGKAITNAMKYALLTAFLLPTGDDPEADASSIDRGQRRTNGRRPETAAPATQPAEEGRLSMRALMDTAEGAGKNRDDIAAAAKKLWGKGRILDLTDEQRWALAAELGLVQETNGQKPAVEASVTPAEPEGPEIAESGAASGPPILAEARRILVDDPDLQAGLDLIK